MAVSEEDRRNQRFVAVNKLEFPERGVVQGWLNGYAKEVRLARLIFTNKDGSAGILYLVCSDSACDYDAMTTSYKKRWQVEVFYKNLKSNAGLTKSPTQTLRTQSSRVFKLECLSIKTRLNPTTLRFKLLTTAIRSAFETLRQ